MKFKNIPKVAVPAFIVGSILGFIATVSYTKPAVLKDGSYTGTSDGHNGPMEVLLKVEGSKVVSAEITQTSESEFARPASLHVADYVLKNGTADGVDAVSGSTVTTKATAAAFSSALAKARGQKEKVVVYKDTECDVVVIGAGGAGMCAATVTAGSGAKTILLEKMGNAGGNTKAATGGLNASETRIQKELGIEDSNEAYINDTMKGGYNKNDINLVRAMVEKSAETVEWLIGLGADLNDVGKMAGSSNKRTHRPKGGAAVGAHLVPVLEKAAADAGAEIRFTARATDLKKSGDGYIVDVECKTGKYSIKAKTVILATGGFGANPDMVVSYKENLKGFGTTNHKGATGDAFPWAEKLGAVLVQMDEIQTHPTVIPGDGTMITEAVRGNGAIMINRDGKRFCTEMATRDVMSKAILEQKGQTAYLVFDQDVRESLKAIEGYAKKNLLTQADTPEALADELGIPSDTFAATMKEYADIQSTGKDPLGRKASEMPRPLTKAPFYAVEVGPAIHHTMGGIKINPETEVLDKNGDAIPGLYAAGEVTGGVHGGNRLGGNAVADICVFGKIAGEQAVRYLNK